MNDVIVLIYFIFFIFVIFKIIFIREVFNLNKKNLIYS